MQGDRASRRYKGLDYNEDFNEDFHKSYFTILNRKKKKPDGSLCHAHADNFNMLKDIVDCFWDIHDGRPPRKLSLIIRDKAMTLNGMTTYKKN
jgi:hypothetical protein